MSRAPLLVAESSIESSFLESTALKMQYDQENKPAESPSRSLEHATDLDRLGYGDEHVECPPHTTESKLVSKIVSSSCRNITM